MPEKKTREAARKDKREGKSASTQAGEYVHEEIEHVREGKHGARSTKQAIAIGLSKARADGVKVPAKKGASKKSTTKKATKKSATRSAAASKALKREPRKAASKTALSRQAKKAAGKRSAASRSAAAKKAARTRARSKK